MLAYATDRRPAGHLHPKTLALIVAGHAVALFAAMTARGDIPAPKGFDPTDIIFVDPVKPPPPPQPPQTKPHEATKSTVDTPDPVFTIPKEKPSPTFDDGPPLPTFSNGNSEVVLPKPVPVPIPVPPVAVTRIGAKPLTAAADLTPPYPDDKRRAGEEALIRLQLSIDPRGRVTQVTPQGLADPSFVEAARKHILKRWRYKPATEDGVAVASSMNVSIRFRLDS